MKVLLIDDDESLCELIVEYFDMHNVEVDVSSTGSNGILLAKKNSYGAIILDLMLPDQSGLTVLKKLMSLIDAPILMLTAKGSDVDQIIGLEMGVDDYIDKPCNPKVLLSRILAVIQRRKTRLEVKKEEFISFENLTLCQGSLKADINDENLKLTTSEFSILVILATHPNIAVSKNEIALSCLGRKIGEYDRSLDFHISRIRRKINEIKPCMVGITTIHGYGYKLEKK